MYAGSDYNNYRTTAAVSPGGPPLLHDVTTGSANGCFGSAHPSGVNFVFCDGSVRQIEFSIDPSIFTPMGNRDRD